MNRKERRAAQKRGQRAGAQSGALPADQVAPMLAQASWYLGRGDLATAEALCGSILASYPDHAGSLYVLAMVAMHARRADVAVDMLGKAIASDDRVAAYHNDMGLALQALGRTDDAIASYRRAIALEPNIGLTYNNLAIALQSQGRIAEASAQFAKAVVHPSAHFEDFQSVCATLFKLNPAIEAGVARAAHAWPIRLTIEELFGLDGYPAVVGDPLLQCILGSSQVRSVEFERMLMSIRSALLNSAVDRNSGVADESDLGFCCALARQCYINEYVFAATPDELAAAEQLKASLVAALAANAALPPRKIAVIASYFALDTIPNAPTLLDRALFAAWPAAFDEVLTLQLREPLEERRLRDTIPAITPVEDATSLRVKQQYEENPYPRWILPASRQAPMLVDDYMRKHWPQVSLRSVGPRETVDVLIAGCGTGKHPIVVAQLFSGARVLAIDLSLASLAYAQRKSRELHVENITYAQADILKLGSLGRTFDVIDASGVLHHLADPVAGWRLLLSLLRPDGLMHVGLYSELARRDVVAARAFCAERGYRPTVQDIRAARVEMFDSRLKGISRFGDFYTTSECRDLLFHVQERRFNVAQIREFLAEHGLRFVGFELAANVRAEYLKRFPSDHALRDLNHWEAFEIEHPDTFSAMYQFWVQKQ